MCLIVLRFDPAAEHPLLMVANRDEFHHRPTAPLAWWPDAPILGGRDLQAGGTWLAVDRNGQFGALTNLRGAPMPKDAPSRGALIPRFLKSGLSPSEFLRELRHEAHRFAGFNLLLGSAAGIWLYSNADPGTVRLLATGIHALSNGRFGEPWPKVVGASRALEAHLHGEGDGASLRNVLADRNVAPDDRLPDTGLALDLERRLSPAFIVSEGYGTRSTTVCALNGSSGWMEETTFRPDGSETSTLRMPIAEMAPLR